LREIYLDNAATTRVDEDAAALALHMMTVEYGNPSSRHKKGLEAERRLREARQRLAAALGAAPEELVLCSGGRRRITSPF
jgi:cysteine desulfurase